MKIHLVVKHLKKSLSVDILSKFVDNLWYWGRLRIPYDGKPKGAIVAWKVHYLSDRHITILFDGKTWWEYFDSNVFDVVKVMTPLKLNEDWVKVKPNIAFKLNVKLPKIMSEKGAVMNRNHITSVYNKLGQF